MSEPTPTPLAQPPIVIQTASLGRLWTLTIISLVLNGLILLIILNVAAIHCWKKHHGMGRGPEARFGPASPMDRERGPGFHHFPGGFGPGSPGGFGDFGRGPGGPEGFRGGPGPKAFHDPAVMTDFAMAHLTENLGLTDDQKAKIKPIVADQIAQIQKQMEAQRAAFQKQVEDAKAKIKPLLNADQQKQLDALPLPGQPPTAPEDKPAEEQAKR